MTDSKARPVRILTMAALLGVLAGAGAVYMTTGAGRNESASICSTDTARTAAMKPLAKGEVAGVVVPDRPRRLPELRFRNGEGKELTLADFKGRTVLLNVWATWCAPCREEMPALNALQAEMGGDAFEVVAVSVDTQGEDKAPNFLRELNISNLALYLDPTARLFQDLKVAGRATGLPTTLLIDGEGCEIGYLPGPADWASEDAKALMRAALGRES